LKASLPQGWAARATMKWSLDGVVARMDPSRKEPPPRTRENFKELFRPLNRALRQNRAMFDAVLD
jgi:hypothetical protein